MPRPLPLLLVPVLSLCAVAVAEQKTLRTDHVTVEYDEAKLEQAYPQAFARVTEAARKAAMERFGFTDVPEQITLRISVDPAQKCRLFTDGQDTFTLQLAGRRQLAPPAWSGIYNLYGMCHELGHVVMYRPIKERNWLTGAASEGWAHYFGSVIVDEVYEKEGESVWPEPYDYRADGTQRLNKQLARAPIMSRIVGSDQTLTAAGLWMELAGIIGEKKLPALFAAWDAAKIDPAEPWPAIREALNGVGDAAKLDGWWSKAEPVLFKPRPRSDFVAAPATAPAKPGAKPTEIALDDGKPVGKLSMAGGGHAVAFEAPGEGSTLTAIKIFGSRYGTPQPPKEDFHIFLCDADGKVIRDFAFPYRMLLRGDARWVTLKCEPTALPQQFILVASFNPAATKGVYCHHDAEMNGDSRTGLPPDINEAFGKGDWMIRALVQSSEAPATSNQKE